MRPAGARPRNVEIFDRSRPLLLAQEEAVEATAADLRRSGPVAEAEELRRAGTSLRRYDSLSRKALDQRAWELKRRRS